MGEAIEQGCGLLRVAEDARPLTESPVCGACVAGALVEFAQQMEQERTARSAEQEVSQLVEDHHISFQQRFDDLSGVSLRLDPLQRIDQLDGRE